MSKRSASYVHMLVTAAGTAGSRVLGLFRDQLTAGFFGTGAVASAFILAFQIPNLFRRLLGEGALTTALMPAMTQEQKRGGNACAFRFLNRVISRTAPWMFAITLIFILIAVAIALAPEPMLTQTAAFFNAGTDIDRHRLAAWLTALCMPYMPMICIAALFSAALNMLGKFTVTALSAVWMNLAMIFSLGVLGWYFGETPEERVVWLCVGALFGGALQLGIPALALYRSGWRPGIDFSTTQAWYDLKAMFVPALIGAGVHQLNLFATRALAFFLDDSALAVYYFANRIVEIPVGIFTVTITTVVFPLLASYAAERKMRELGETFSYGMRLILAINVPATLGIIVLAQPLVRGFFQHGNFSAADTALTVPVLYIFALAVPFYAVSGLVGRAFSSLKDTQTQMRVGMVTFVLNLILSPLLGWHFKACGLAAANLLAAVFQCLVLLVILRRRERVFFEESLLGPIAKVLAASGAMAAATWGAWRLAVDFCNGFSWGLLAAFFIVVPVAVGFYFLLLKLLRFPECDELIGIFLNKFLKRRKHEQ